MNSGPQAWSSLLSNSKQDTGPILQVLCLIRTIHGDVCMLLQDVAVVFKIEIATSTDDAEPPSRK